MICHTKAQWAALPLLLLGLTPTGVPAAQEGPPVVTIEPPCPVLPRATPDQAKKESKPVEVRITYNPSAPGARLRSPQTLRLDLGINAFYYADKQGGIPLDSQNDGSWTGTLNLTRGMDYLIFLVRDEQNQIDDNNGRYWEVLSCGEDGTPAERAVSFQAESYSGRLVAPGIQRPQDYRRGIALLEADLERHPDRFGHLHSLWYYKVAVEGKSAQAYEKVAEEIRRFLARHETDLRALETAFSFVGSFRKQLPVDLPKRFLAQIRYLDPNSRVLGEEMYSRANEKDDPREVIQALRAFVEKFPEHARTQSAHARIFKLEATKLKSREGAERAFRAWAAHEPESPDPYASMADFYLRNDIELDKAVELLDRALEAYNNEPHTPGGILMVVTVNKYSKEDGAARLRSWRGEAKSKQGRTKEAVADLVAASVRLSDDPTVYFNLGQAYEELKEREKAFQAYLEAATCPHQSGPEPLRALERVFIQGGMGTREELEKRIAARIDARRTQAAVSYRPMPLNRPAPLIEFQTIGGEQYDGKRLRGQPVVLNLWATWCRPCIPELAGFQKLQKRNPQIVVAAIAVGSKLEDVKPILEKNYLDSLRVALSDAVADAFKNSSVPTTYVLDRKGRIRFVHSGAIPDVLAILEKDLAFLAGEAME